MIITQTPLRISFVGGGTDFRDFYCKQTGEVISTAIDKYVYVIIKERYDLQIYLNYSKKEIVNCVDEIEHELIREAMRKTGVTQGIEITTLADIPAHGSGLGSSSCVTVGVLNALYAYQGSPMDRETLAQEACEIEIELLGKPIGKQDQYIAAYGGMKHIQFMSDESVRVEGIPISEETKRKLNANTLLFYTGIERRASEILIEQQQNSENNFEILCEMKPLVRDLKEVLINYQNDGHHSLDQFGHILHRGWQLKQKLASKISNPQLDEMYEAAFKAGALGGKLLGAGGGGFFLFYASPEKHDAIRAALRHLQEFPFNLERDGSKVIFNIRR
ncbi:GHMP kinase [Candidatus Poribacteria bacterium]|nr:GHMP kinase [Candidatus Poribacteria bacterium]